MLTTLTIMGCANQASQTKTETPKDVTEKKEKEGVESKAEETKGNKVSTGQFEGKSNHKTTGTATIIKTEGGFVLELGEDFTFDDAPDPKWAFGKDGFKKETIFAPLKSKNGKQSYKIPESINPAEFNEVYLWCEEFNVPLGVAKLG